MATNLQHPRPIHSSGTTSPVCASTFWNFGRPPWSSNGSARTRSRWSIPIGAWAPATWWTTSRSARRTCGCCSTSSIGVGLSTFWGRAPARDGVDRRRPSPSRSPVRRGQRHRRFAPSPAVVATAHPVGGVRPPRRSDRTRAPGLVRIMVTMPSEAGADPAVIESLLAQGMTIMRVNCAHDGPATWQRMIDQPAAARSQAWPDVPYRIRSRRSQTAHWPHRPRDPRSSGFARFATTWPMPRPPAVRFGPKAALRGPIRPVLPIDRLLCTEARVWRRAAAAGRSRATARLLGRRDRRPDDLLCSCDRTAYLATGLPSRCTDLARGSVGLAWPAASRPKAGSRSKWGTSWSSPGIWRRVIRPCRQWRRRVSGPRRLAARCRRSSSASRSGTACCSTTANSRAWSANVFARGCSWRSCGRGAARPAAGREGVELPGHRARPARTDGEDIEDLEFVVSHADLVSLSFVNCAADIEALYRHLAAGRGRLVVC